MEEEDRELEDEEERRRGLFTIGIAGGGGGWRLYLERTALVAGALTAFVREAGLFPS